jgi:DNA-binding GntR family transcriptional regulator
MVGRIALEVPKSEAKQADAAPSAQRITVAIEADIIEGRLKAGSRLDEESLAARFGVSRTPVREALRVLAAHGVVELQPRVGAIVASPTMGEVIDLFETVAELEAAATRLAVERIGTDSRQREQIVRGHNACALAARGGNPDLYFAANNLFHAAIHDAAMNLVLVSAIGNLGRRLAPYRRFITLRPERTAVALREHEGILVAILAGDATAAANAMREHVRILGDDAIAMAKTLRFV